MEKRLRLLDLEKVAGGVICWLSMVIFLFLTVASLFFTRYFPADYGKEIPLNRLAVFPVTFLGSLAIFGFILWLSGLITAIPEKQEQNMRLLLYVDLAWIVISGIVWVQCCLSEPVSDQKLVLTTAQRFLEGNYGRLEYGKYLFIYPHQLGLVAYEEQILRIFGQENLTALLVFNVFGIAGAVYAGYQITRYLFSEKRVTICYLLLVGICFPFLLYSAYFYGDVLAITLSLFSIWQLLRYMKKEKKSSIFFLTLGLCGAVLVRNNSLIVLVACICVLVLKGIVYRRLQYLLCVLVIFAGIIAGRQGVWLSYEKRCGHEINEGMPKILHVAMGMQEGDKDAGWYNGYNIYTYQDVCLYHEPTAAELGKAEVRARAKEFLFHPGYALDFFWRKFTSQWNEPTYGCFIMTYATEQERGPFAHSIFEGGANRALKAFMDCYQLLIYGMVFLFLIFSKKRSVPLEDNILLIGILGGVLFHMLWEAKSRYVLPYFVMMLPMAAAGLVQTYQRLQMMWRRKNEAAKAGR